MYNSSGSMGSGLTSKLKVKVILAVVFLIAVGVVLREAFKESDYVYIPIQKGPDLCDLWKKEASDFTPTKWWQYACLIERHMDGPKEYKCKDVRMKAHYPVCFDEPYKPGANCLVYSFGINNEWGFDESMAAEGCTVYSFDPSMGQPDHTHSERVYFKNMGLGAEDSDTFQPNMDSYVNHITKWKMRTLKSIMKELGHEKRTIDVLKIDIEVYEWEVLANIIRDGIFPQVKQFHIEYHIFPNAPFRNQFKEVYDVYTNFNRMGFKFYHSESRMRYHHYLYFNSQGDMCYVNTKYTPPV